jgi:predicted 3-demethylubiquinone-9 3-methyltransferase (glyoxalase superfamily)
MPRYVIWAAFSQATVRVYQAYRAAWSKLSADPKAEQCGWLKDKFGISWQIVPTLMDAMLQHKNETKVARVTEAFLKMKKFDIAKLKEAYGQERSSA